MRNLKKMAVLASALTMALVAAACGSAPSTATGAADGATCGAVPNQMPADPDGVLATLPDSTRAAFNLYPETIRASAWANWKPSHPGPFVIHYNPGRLTTSFDQEFLATLNALKGDTEVVVKDANGDPQVQLQQLRQSIQEKPDLMIVMAQAPAAVAAVLDEAGKAGIPSIVPLFASSSPYIVGIDGNNPLKGAYLARDLAKLMNGQGSLMEMLGKPGTQATDAVYQGADAVFATCPDIQIAGKPVGQYDPAAAKSQTLQFLSAHPQPIDGGMQVGGMAGAMIQAFEQLGRPVPPIADLGATPAALSYWNEHKDTYKGVGLALPVAGLAETTWNVASGILAGRGLEVNEVLQQPTMITADNLAQWVKPEWNLNTPQTFAPAPPGVYYPKEYLDTLFANPGN
ncbi:substrate-binding domain-containing protein [Pseudonocardia kujensis]|uniref:substrate-binding domain-containing protein n=1 Tax=Pseudonocardia kujensis TaxID=1128675 RepID=UPI001E36A4EA|nr:substrate-binding domain-containing protein [Pseudonocardia kujensis]MCE0766884.1 substrate-binding domain-containing protein [Pseudonocardia kujensis]